nr:DNA-binding protein [Fournierella sp. CML151]
MRYLSITQISEKWNISPRWINDLCSGERISSAMKIGSYGAILEDAERPKDARIKSGRYIKNKR